MGGRLLVGLIFLVGMIGCASTRQTMTNQMELRIGELEREVAQKDDEISNLQDQVEQLQGDLKRKEKGSVEISSSLSKKDRNIIRVNVTAGQIQIALKKAGYYDGAIDGKLGANTKNAIMKFQKDNNLKADGVIGKQTWEKLQAFVE